jgi:hypothetical protein
MAVIRQTPTSPDKSVTDVGFGEHFLYSVKAPAKPALPACGRAPEAPVLARTLVRDAQKRDRQRRKPSVPLGQWAIELVRLGRRSLSLHRPPELGAEWAHVPAIRAHPSAVLTRQPPRSAGSGRLDDGRSDQPGGLPR